MADFDLATYLNLHGSQTRTIFGTWNTGLGRGDFLYLDYVLHNYANISRFLELGTMHGLTTVYLGVTSAIRSGSTISWDIVDLIPPHIRSVASMLPIAYNIGDVLHDNSVIVRIRHAVQEEHVMLFCDNGDKEKEIGLYAAWLRQGNVLMVHDWGTEVHWDNIKEYLQGYKPIDHDVAEKMYSHMRAWVKDE